MEPLEARRWGRGATLGWAAALALSCATAPPRVTGTWDLTPPDAPLRPDLVMQPVQVASLARWKEHLVAVLGDGRRAAWRTSDLEYEPALSEALDAAGVEAVGTEGDTLLGLTADWVLAWAPEQRRWSRRYPVASTPEVVERFVTWPGGVAVVYEDHVFEARRQRSYPVPPLADDDEDASELHLRDAFGQGSQLWLGDSQGEFGGHLVGLDLDRGAWTQRRTSSPVVAIAGDGEGLLVAGALSHLFSVGSQLERVDRSGAVVASLARVEGAYYRKLARGLDGSPWVVEEQRLSRVDEAGRPRPVAELGSLRYGVEPNAVGVSPGVLALLAVDERTWAVLPELAPVVVVRDGVARVLGLPPRPASRYVPVSRTTSGRTSLTSNGAVAELFCGAGLDGRDRWSFVDPEGLHRVADSCAFPLPGAVADFRRRPVEPGRWVFADARGRRLTQLDISVGPDGSVVAHRRWWGPNGHLVLEGTRRLEPCCADLGTQRSYHRNGRLAEEETVEAGGQGRHLTQWHPNGVKALSGRSEHGHRIGLWTRWYLNGQKQAEGTLSEGGLQGTLIEWYPDGRKRRERTFRNGEPLSVREWDRDGHLTERAPQPWDGNPAF